MDTLGQIRARSHGFSLPTTLALGAVSVLWVSAALAIVMPTYQRTTVTKMQNEARGACESALDAVTADLVKGVATGQSSQYDCGNGLDTKKESYVSTATTGFPNAKTFVRIYNRTPSSSSTLYDSTVQMPPGQNPYYRVIEAETRIPSWERPVVTKRIRCILEPTFSQGGVIWPYAAFGAGDPADLNRHPGMTVIGRVTVDSYSPTEAPNMLKDSLSANLGSNVATSHVGQNYYNYMRLGGNQYEFPNPVANQTTSLQNVGSQFNATLVTQAKWCQYMGNVYSNGSSTAHYPAGPQHFNLPSSATPVQALQSTVLEKTHTSGDEWRNVLGLNNTHPTTGVWEGGKVEAYAQYNQLHLPPAPDAPATNGTSVFSLGNVSLSSSAKIVFAADATPYAADANISRSSGTIYLPPGEYKMKSLSMSGSSAVQIPSTLNVKIYFEGTVSGNNVLSVSKYAQLNNATGANARNLEIYYKGSKDLAINGNSRALIYAPNARIFVGTGSRDGDDTYDIEDFNAANYGGMTDMDFWGSVTGKSVYIMAYPSSSSSRVRFHYDRTLVPANFPYLQPWGSTQASFTAQQHTGMKVVSWQEDPPPLP